MSQRRGRWPKTWVGNKGTSWKGDSCFGGSQASKLPGSLCAPTSFFQPPSSVPWLSLPSPAKM